MSTSLKKYHVGEIRPSQLLLSYGVGALIDLPHFSAIVMGLDDWDIWRSHEIQEERLLRAIQSILGRQVQHFYTPPVARTSSGNPFAPESLIGVPVATFPRWMVCPRCRLLASIDSGHFQLKKTRQWDRAHYVHTSCKGEPTVLPSRFLIACEEGHLDDFPWHDFVHGKRPCNGLLYMREYGVSGEPSDIVIHCEGCNTNRVMSLVFSSEEEQQYRPMCSGRRPHLRDFEPGKAHEARPMLLAASNTWFPLVFSTLSIPGAEDRLGQLVEQHWARLQTITDRAEFNGAFKFLPPQFFGYTADEIWLKIEQRRAAIIGEESAARPADLKLPEWHMLSNPDAAPRADDFTVTPVSAPDGYDDLIRQVVLVERLREVRVLTGFTRIESLADYAEEEELPTEHIMRLSRKAPEWLPAAEVRGEGVFIQFREEAIQRWLNLAPVRQRDESIYESHRRWRQSRHIPEPEAAYPGIRYVLLHTFAHALMRQLTLESGYTGASIRERIYALPPTNSGGPMAGVLLYTAASDSEGTLGGLVSLGRPDRLGWHIDGALEEMAHCASDPLCAEHESREDHSLHEAACHACLFVPETACERGNKYLDRSLLVSTVKRGDLAFFHRSFLITA